MGERKRNRPKQEEEQDDKTKTDISSRSPTKRGKKSKTEKSTKTTTKTKEPTIHYTEYDTKHRYLLACRNLFKHLKTKISTADAVADPSKLLNLVPEEFSEDVTDRLDLNHCHIIAKYDPHLRGYRLYHYIASFELIRTIAECKQDDILCCPVIDHNMLRKTFKILLHHMYQESLDDTSEYLDIFGRKKVISVSSKAQKGYNTKIPSVPPRLEGLGIIDQSIVYKDFWKRTRSNDYTNYISFLDKCYRSCQVMISSADNATWEHFYKKKLILRHPAQKVANKAPRKPTTRSSSSTYTEMLRV